MRPAICSNRRLWSGHQKRCCRFKTMVSPLNPCGSMCYPACLRLHGRSNTVLFTLAFPRFHGLFAQCCCFVQCSEFNHEQSCSYAQFLLVYFLIFTSRSPGSCNLSIPSYFYKPLFLGSSNYLHVHFTNACLLFSQPVKTRFVKFTVHNVQ